MTLTHSKGQGHAYLYSEYLGNRDSVKLLLPSNSKTCMSFQLAYFHLILTHSKGQYQDEGEAHFDSEL